MKNRVNDERETVQSKKKTFLEHEDSESCLIFRGYS